MSEGGVDGADYLKFMAEESGNVAADGMFSIQVSPAALNLTRGQAGGGGPQ